jgi:hypothetical protein
MGALGAKRRIQSLDDRELAEYWRTVALTCCPLVDPVSGRLPPMWQAIYAECVEEYARRGVQLALF